MTRADMDAALRLITAHVPTQHRADTAEALGLTPYVGHLAAGRRNHARRPELRTPEDLLNQDHQ